MAEHSPLPWRVYEGSNVMSAEEYPYGLVAECDMGITGEEDKPALWEANAAFIVRAVNAHETLIRGASLALMEHAAYRSEAGEGVCMCDQCLLFRPIVEAEP